jgi:hypothetical protein
VIDVSMGNDDVFDLEIVFSDDGENIFDVIARINHHGFTSDFVSDDRAVALKRANAKDFVNHGGSLSAISRQLPGFAQSCKGELTASAISAAPALEV